MSLFKVSSFSAALCFFLSSVFLVPSAQVPQQLQKLETSKDLAEKLDLAIEPVFHWRHSQGISPYGSPTLSLSNRRRAFSPGEEIKLTLRLPPNAKAQAVLLTKGIFTLHDIQGQKLQEIGEAKIHSSPESTRSEGMAWTVPAVSEAEYFLAARFLDAERKPLTTRSEVIFITPEYTRLRAGAEKAVAGAVERLANADLKLRRISLPLVEMMIEEANMRWDDFGQAQRDWPFVKLRLETAARFANKLAERNDPFHNQTGVFIKAYRSGLDDTLQPYPLYVPKSYNPSRAYPLLVSLHGATSNHRINLRRVFGLGNRPGESDYEATRNEVEFPAVDSIVVSPYGRGEIAGYSGPLDRES